MKRVLFIFAILGLTTMVAFGQTSRENRTVTAFTGINASGIINITVQRGNTHSLVIEADNTVMPYVRSAVRDGVLHLYLDREFERRFRNNNGDVADNITINVNRNQIIRNGNAISGNDNTINPVNATVVMPNLECVTLAGVNTLIAEDLFTPDRFRFNGSGVSNLTINLNTNQLEIESRGVSNIEINANVREMARFNSPGVSNISGNLVTERVTFDIGGVGNITLSGSATNARINAGGVPQLDLIDFPIQRADVNAGGVGSVTVNATESLSINAHGLATIRYTGTATVQKNVGRMSSVSRL